MSDDSNVSDEVLVRRVRAGDEAAARLLFERHLPALRPKARARIPAALRGRVAESDVIQDAWLAAFLDVGEFEDRGDGSFGKWLRGILEHKILDEVRRHAGVSKRNARRAAIEDLPSDQATVLRWIHQQGVTLVEAGRRMGRSADAVRKLYGRAIVRLGGRLGGGQSTTS